MSGSYIFHIWKKDFSVRDEYELALIFELAECEEIQKDILQQIGDEWLMKLIQTGEWLLKVLKPLLGRNKFLLMFLVSDTLPIIIGSAQRLAYILSGIINQVDRTLLIKRIRQKWLLQIIHEATGLSAVLEWNNQEWEEIILRTIASENLVRLLPSADDVYEVLHFLVDLNKDLLIEILTFQVLKKKVHRFKDFVWLVRGMSEQMAYKFIYSYSSTVLRELMDDDRQGISLIKKLSIKKESILMDYLTDSITINDV